MRNDAFLAVLLFMVTAATTTAFAQSMEAPLRKGGLFGTTRSDGGNRDALNLLFDVGEMFDSELPPALRLPGARDPLDPGGYSSMLTTSADYTRTRRRTQLGATLLTSFRYYSRLDRVSSVSHSGGLGFTVRLPKQSSLQANSTIAYAPAYLYQLFPRDPINAAAEAIAVDPDYRIDRSDSYTYGTNVTLAIAPARGTRVTATADYRQVDFKHAAIVQPNLTTRSAKLNFSRALSRNSGVSVEYEYRTGTFGLTGASNEQRLTLGADYSRAVSATRRAVFHFTIAPAVLTVPDSVVLASLPIAAFPIDPEAVPNSEVESASNRNAQLYRLEGDARVAYDLGRSWRAAATYHRGAEYLAVLTEPVFSDAARVEVNGLLTRRLDVSAVGGSAVARSALTPNAPSLRTDTGQLRLRYALKRSLAVYSQYLYYYFDLRDQSRLAPGLPPQFKQHEIRVGFMVFARPLANKGKGKTTWPDRTR